MARVIAVVNLKGRRREKRRRPSTWLLRWPLAASRPPRGRRPAKQSDQWRRPKRKGFGAAGTVYQALTTEIPTDPAAVHHPDRRRRPDAHSTRTGTSPVPRSRWSRSHIAKSVCARSVPEPVRGDFDYVFIDCPPSLGLLTLNALVAADAVLIPLHCEYFALEGLADLVGTMRRVRWPLNPLDIEGVLLTMFDERTNLGQQVAADVRQFFKEKVFRTVIPRNVRLERSAEPWNARHAVRRQVARGAEAYFALAREVTRRGHGGLRRLTQNGKASHAIGAWQGLSALIPDEPEPLAPTERARRRSSRAQPVSAACACR